MRATHPLRLRRSSTLRRLTTFTAATTLALTIGSCNIGGSDEAPVISSSMPRKQMPPPQIILETSWTTGHCHPPKAPSS